MESKKKLPYDPKEVPKEKRFRANLSDAFLSGDVSGQRAHSLFADAEDAGASNVGDLAGNHQPGMNSARDLTRKLLKEHQWPTYIGLPSLSGRRKNSKKKKNFCLSFYLTKSCTSSANFLIFPSSEISIHCLQKTWRSFKEEQTFCRLKLSNCFHLVCGWMVSHATGTAHIP